jgi:hypothetical protein
MQLVPLHHGDDGLAHGGDDVAADGRLRARGRGRHERDDAAADVAGDVADGHDGAGDADGHDGTLGWAKQVKFSLSKALIKRLVSVSTLEPIN